MKTPTRTLIIAGIASLAAGASALAQDLVHKAPAQAKPVAIINGTVHPIMGPVIEKGVVQFAQGKVTLVGPMDGATADALKSQGFEVVDASGKHVYPGLIGAYTQLGLQEISAVRATLDTGEVGSATPEVRACVSVNPDSTLIPVTRSAGVLIAGVFPATSFDGQLAYFSGPGGFMPGRASVMRLDGWTWEDMTIADDAGLVVNWPQARPITAWWMNKSENDQQKDIDKANRAIDAMFSGAKAYLAERQEHDAKDKAMPRDIRYEAMRGVLEPKHAGHRPMTGESAFGVNPTTAAARKPVFIHAHDYDQIVQALALAARYELRLVIVGGRDAPMCAQALKDAKASVIVTGTQRFPKRDDSAYDEAYTLPARLEEAGIDWCMASGEIAAHERNLPNAAAMAVAYGLDHDVGVAAITIRPARILGIDNAYGSIEKGKSATIIITDGDILEVTTRIEGAFIDGRTIDLSDKQKALADKYRDKYRQADAEKKRNGETPAAPRPATGGGR